MQFRAKYLEYKQTVIIFVIIHVVFLNLNNDDELFRSNQPSIVTAELVWKINNEDISKALNK